MLAVGYSLLSSNTSFFWSSSARYLFLPGVPRRRRCLLLRSFFGRVDTKTATSLVDTKTATSLVDTKTATSLKQYGIEHATK